MISPTARPNPRPPRWPSDHAARALLEEWVAGGQQAHVYATAVDFRGCDLSDLTFEHFFANGCSFNETTLRGTFLGGGYLPESDFSGADLTGAILAKAQMNGAIFTSAVMRETNLLDVEGDLVSFVDTDLRGARVGGSLWRSDFTRADLRGATMFGASLRDSLLHGTRIQGLSGELFGPIRVGDDGEAVTLHGDDAESWLRHRGAEVTIRDLGGDGSR